MRRHQRAAAGTRSLFLHAALCVLICGSAASAVPDGYVVRVETSTVYLDWGQSSGVQAGDGFSLYRQGAVLKHPVTGALLGHAEEAGGAGVVERVEDKFSIGRMSAPMGTPRAGDRSKWLPRGQAAAASVVGSASAVPASVPAASSPDAALVPAAPSLNELWRSEPLEKNAVGLTFTDLDGDGQKDLIVAFRKKIQVYRLKDKRLEPLAAFDDRKYGQWLAIDAADLKQEGREELFATAYQHGINRPRVVVLRFENGSLKPIADFEGFARAIVRPDGSKRVYWQTLSRAQDLSYTAVSELAWDKAKNTYRPGPPLDLKLSKEQLFGFLWGDWYNAGGENFAVLEKGERIRVYSPDVKWKSSEVYGGTKNDFPFGNDTVGSLFPRLLNWRPAQGTKNQLVVIENIPDFGLRMRYLKMYKKSEVSGLVWNGLEMKPAWRVSINGYLADYGIADILGTSAPQLWVAAGGPGDKTILLSYSLP
jgi:hypothetical protein